MPGAGFVVFGGASFCGQALVPDSSFWRWSQGTWQPYAATFGDRREDALLAWDARRNVLILHGGRAGPTVHTDTWEWNGRVWRRVSAGGEGSPGPLEHAGAAFDQHRGRLVVFGGASRVDRQARNTVWEWDGARWEQRIPEGTGPAGRIGPSMAYSPGDRAVLMYGGFNQAGSFRDLWRWDGSSWTSVHTEGPTFTEGQSLVTSDTAVLVVGTGVSDAAPWERALAVWRWEGGRWTRVGGDGPPGRVGNAIGYDDATGSVVLFGGAIPNAPPFADTWTFRGEWQRVR